jgi:alpha-L-fucosidase
MNGLILSDCDLHLLNTHNIRLDKSNGYFRVYFNKTYVYLHRFLIDAKKGEIVDHIDRNKLNNRRENLRIVSYSLNSYNKEVQNKNGRGIYFDKAGNRYRACIGFNNKTLKLGSFKTIEEAKKAYNLKSKEIHGENAFQHILD